MTTFSQLIDDVCAELLRPDMKESCAAYANQTVRELHFRPNLNAPVLYDANRHEDSTLALTANPFLWTIPSVTRFIDVEAMYIREMNHYVEPRNPTIVHRETSQPFSQFYRYRTGSKIAVAGIVEGHTLDVSYFMYPPSHRYLKTTERLIKFDVDLDQYVYINGGGIATEEDVEKETNWMIQRWDSTVREGVRAKAWKRLGDDTRTRMSFSAYESMRASVWQSEPSS